MFFYVVKLLVSALIIVVVSELAKRNSGLAALIAALPLTSLLAFVWMRLEGSGNTAIADLSGQIFWLVIPSLLMFVALAFLLRQGTGFWLGLGASAGLTIAAYLALLPFLRKMGVSI
jgi:accessory gene regulator protein AgrB